MKASFSCLNINYWDIVDNNGSVRLQVSAKVAKTG